ncbi:MAG: cell division protein FtsQ/DivIB [Pseudomonadota bacterium]
MSAVEPGSREYSPSRMQYRWERIWLTPLYRSLIRTGVPVALVAMMAVGHFSKAETQAQLAMSVANARSMVENRPEFAVELMQIKGGSEALAQEVREAVPLTFPQSSLRLDLAALKADIERVDAVARADVALRGSVLEVRIQERLPVLIWRGADHLELVDATGARAGVVAVRDGFHHLPLIMGTSAQAAAPEALSLIAAAGPLRGRIRALRRMGQRRWDLVLDREQVIKLPVEAPVTALERVVALHSARDVLGRDVTVVDLRDGRRPVLRLSRAAVEELHRLRAIADEEEEG